MSFATTFGEYGARSSLGRSPFILFIAYNIDKANFTGIFTSFIAGRVSESEIKDNPQIGIGI